LFDRHDAVSMKISDIPTYFTDTIFRRDASEWRNPVVRWLVQQYKLLFYTARGLQEHGTLVRSAALTFYTLMSLVPIAAVVFAVVKGFGLADGLVENLYALFPQNPEIVRYIVDFAENALGRTQGGVVAAVALVMLFWAVIRVFGSIESAFNNIWEVKVERGITRQWTDYIAVVMIVPVLWIVANAMTNYAERLLGFDDSWYFGLLSHLASMVVIWGMFTLLYLVIPNAKVRVGSALMAGIVAGTIFLLFQWGYVYLQRWMTSYNAIYGSFAALPLFLIWLQTSWEILLFGGELSFAYQNVERFDEELIVRSAQVHALMPMMQFSVAPWRILSPENAAVCARYAQLHRQFGPYILSLAHHASKTGEPIVRAMEYAFPHEGFLECRDQFMLGDRYLVAPMVTPGTQREVRLPRGVWRDDRGETFRGPKRIETDVPLDRLPYYERIR